MYHEINIITNDRFCGSREKLGGAVLFLRL